MPSAIPNLRYKIDTIGILHKRAKKSFQFSNETFILNCMHVDYREKAGVRDEASTAFDWFR